MNMNTLSRALVLALALPFFPGCSSDDGVAPPPPPPPPPVVRTLTVLVTGNGTVSSADGGITACSSTCSAEYDDDAVVRLTATAGTGSVFRAWTGLCTPVTNAPEQCDVTMTADLTVAAVFDTPASGGLGDMFALTKSGRLLSFDRASPGTILSDQVITGIGTDQILTIDYRPSNGLLFAVARRTAAGFEGKGRLYIIDEASAVATLVAEMSSAAGALGDPATWNYEMAFQPGSSLATNGGELIRMLAHDGDATGKLFTINPDGGVTSINDQQENYSATGIAYTNAFKGTAFRTAYALESGDKVLAILDTGGSSSFTNVGGFGPTPATVPAANGFAIDGETGATWVAFNNGTNPALYSISLTAGTLSGEQQIGDATLAAEQIAGLAIEQPPEPQIFGICEESNNADLNTITCAPGLTLVRFTASNPGTYDRIADVTGMGAGEKIIAMDVKPSTGELYALSDAKKIYTVNTINGAATLVSVINEPWDIAEVPVVGFDFNPNDETLRIVGGDADGNATVTPGATNINFTVDPSTNPATVTVLAAPQQLPFKLTSVAFTNNVPNTQSTAYYGIDSENNRLFTVDTNTSAVPGTNPGRVTFSRNLTGITATNIGGFEIVGSPETAYVMRSDGSNSYVYTLVLSTGAAAQHGAGAIGSLSGFSGELVGLSAPVNQGSNTKLFAASTDAAPNARLVAFKATFANPLEDPRFLTNNNVISGMVAGETILAMDFRFSNNANTLYVLARGAGDVGRLYTLTEAGAATPVAISGNLTSNLAPYVLEGQHYGMDVDPTNGNIRIVSDANENLSVNPTTGVVTVVADLAQTPIPFIGAAAYSRNFAGSTDSQLYLFDTNAPSNDQLMTISSAQLVSRMGPSTVSNFGDEVNLDILGGQDGLPIVTRWTCATQDPQCFASGFTDIFAINVTSGVATRIGTVGSDETPIPEDTRIRLGAMAIRFPQ